MTTQESDDTPWESDRLEVKRVGRRFRVTWPEAGVSILSPKARRPSATSLRANGDLRLHGMFGYSVGAFHEFFIDAVSEAASFRLGKAVVNIGRISPLAMFLFELYYRRKAHGDEWNYISTAQVEGVSAEAAEVYLLNALQVYGERTGDFPAVISFGPVEWWEAPKRKRLPTRVSAVNRDLEPLRFFYHGSRETDDAAACIQFYRVLEFYAFFDLEATVSGMRRDQQLLDRDFLKQIVKTVSRDERTPIARLIRALSTPKLLAETVRLGIIAHPNAELFAGAAYDFRNSIVHAKYDHRSAIESQPVFESADHVHGWRHIFEELARKAIERSSEEE